MTSSLSAAAGQAFSPDICRHLVIEHMDLMRTKEYIGQVEHVIRQLNHRMTHENCPPLNETSCGPHLEDRAMLKAYLFDRAETEIRGAASACMIDQTLKELNRCNQLIGSRLSEDDKQILAVAVNDRIDAALETFEPGSVYHVLWADWREPALHNLHLLKRDAIPQLSLAA